MERNNNHNRNHNNNKNKRNHSMKSKEHDDEKNTTTIDNNRKNNPNSNQNNKRRKISGNKTRKVIDHHNAVDNQSTMNDEIQRLNELIQKTIPSRGYVPSLTERIAFRTLPISDRTIRGLDYTSYHTMTAIQHACIPHALIGRDILAAAQTGSGKTLAFLIPIIETLYRNHYTSSYNEHGVGAIILIPTRELGIQIFQILQKICKYHNQLSCGLLIGGQKDFYIEQQNINSTNIIIATPGRLLQHLEQTPYFTLDNLRILVLDEADRILDMGFRSQLISILDYLPSNSNDNNEVPDNSNDNSSTSFRRQTLLFSATQTRDIKALATLSLYQPEYIGVHDLEKTDTPTSLQQYYVVVPLEHKLNAIYSFIKTHLHDKTIMFMNTCSQVRYCYELFCTLRPGITILALHGKLSQERRTQIYMNYINKTTPIILLCTDIAARGLDFPNIDWVIQIDAPEDRNMYIHRVGRTARYRSNGKSLLLLTPKEEHNGFITNILRADIIIKNRNNNDNNNEKNNNNDKNNKSSIPSAEVSSTATASNMNKNKIPLTKLNINPKKATIVTDRAASIVASNVRLNELAKKAFYSYIRCIYYMPHKDIYQMNDIEYDKYSTSLGLSATPSLKKVFQTLTKGNDNTNDSRDEYRKLKNVNTKLQRLKEQIKIDKLAKKIKKLDEQKDNKEDNKKDDKDDDSSSDSDSDDHESDDNESDDDDAILVPKGIIKTTEGDKDVDDDDIDQDPQFPSIDQVNQLRHPKKIRVDGSNTNNKRIVFNDDGQEEDVREMIIKSTTTLMNDILPSPSLLKEGTDAYVQKVQSRLQKNKELDDFDHKERLRLKRVKKRSVKDNENDNDDKNIVTLDHDPINDDDDDEVDDRSSTSSNDDSNSSDEIHQMKKNTKRGSTDDDDDGGDDDDDREAIHNGTNDNDDDDDTSSSIYDDDDDSNAEVDVKMQEEMALSLIRGGSR